MTFTDDEAKRYPHPFSDADLKAMKEEIEDPKTDWDFVMSVGDAKALLARLEAVENCCRALSDYIDYVDTLPRLLGSDERDQSKGITILNTWRVAAGGK